VLGAIILNPTALPKAQRLLHPDDFFRRAHQAVYAACVRLVDEQRREVDLVTLNQELVRSRDMDEVGGPAYISALTDGVPRSTNVEHYAMIVKELAQRRLLIDAGERMVDDGYDTKVPIDQIATRADRTILDVQQGETSDRLRPLQDTLSDMLDDIASRDKLRGQVTGIETGYASINELTSGWQRGDLIVVAARPSIGKTVFVLNTGAHAAMHGAGVVVFSLEMRRRQLEFRLLSQLSKVPATRITGGWLGEQDYERMVQATSVMHDLRIYIDDTAGRTVWDIRAACRRLKADKRIDLVIVDYVQLMHGSLDQKGATRSQEIDDIALRLKTLADEVSCPVILVSQLNRRSDDRADKRPILSDLRDSGALEQHADLVCFLHRKHHRENGVTQFIIEKQRNGPTGAVNLTITREIQTFEDGGVEPVQEALPEPQAVSATDVPKRWRGR
jgi:replicative DNA helicase